MDIGSAITAYNGLKSVKEIFSSIKELKNDTEIQGKLNEAADYVGKAQDTIFELRDNLSKLQEENSDLRREIEENENWKHRIQSYELVTTEGGATVYKFKNSPEHYACTNCIEDKSIGILQDDHNAAGTYLCSNPKCGAEFSIILKERTNDLTNLLEM